MKTDAELSALTAYDEHPAQDGDVVLLLDDRVCLELEGLGNEWEDDDGPLLASMLATTSQRVLPCVARPCAGLLPSDRRLWALLHQHCTRAGLEVLPLQALPAAA